MEGRKDIPVCLSVEIKIPFQDSHLIIAARNRDRSMSMCGGDGGPPPPVAFMQESSSSRKKNMRGKRVGFTTPALYAQRLQKRLQQQDAIAVWAPSISVRTTPQSKHRIRELLLRQPSPRPLAGIAFTSRAGIAALQEVLQEYPELAKAVMAMVHAQEGEFFMAALGKDADLVVEMDLLGTRSGGIRKVVPDVATPRAMVEKLGEGHGRCVICPVPSVEGGLEEPPVVPQFLADLAAHGWIPLRLDAYVTSWMGSHCALPLLPLSHLDALLFTSTAEVQGLLKSLEALDVDPQYLRIHHDYSYSAAAAPSTKKPVIIGVHGPVTAAGALRFGIQPHVVSTDSSSFQGIIDALDLYWDDSTSGMAAPS